MITLIEGPDCAGKTTLARKICELTGATYLHQGPYQRDVLTETLDLLAPALRDGRDVVCDRLHVGELVYGPIMRHKCMMTSVERRMINRVLLAHETLVVFALPPKEVVINNWRALRERRDEYVQGEGLLEAIWSAYKTRLYEITDLPHVHWDYTTDRSVEAMLHAVPRPPKNEGPGVGVFREGVTLLVGERFARGTLGDGGWRFPFVGSMCSAWVTGLLEEWRVFESSLYWVNAVDGLERETDPSFVERLKPARVIALGNWAQDWVIRHNIEHTAVSHPQYWKRFHHNDVYPLRHALDRI